MTLRQCPWVQPRPWDRSFHLFASTENSFVSVNHTFLPPELPSLVDFTVDRGPESLLHLLPQPTRKIIGKMLALNPKSRATIEEIRSDEWYHGISGCRRPNSMQFPKYEAPTMGGSKAGSIERLAFGYAILLSTSNTADAVQDGSASQQDQDY